MCEMGRLISEFYYGPIIDYSHISCQQRCMADCTSVMDCCHCFTFLSLQTSDLIYLISDSNAAGTIILLASSRFILGGSDVKYHARKGTWRKYQLNKQIKRNVKIWGIAVKYITTVHSSSLRQLHYESFNGWSQSVIREKLFVRQCAASYWAGGISCQPPFDISSFIAVTICAHYWILHDVQAYNTPKFLRDTCNVQIRFAAIIVIQR